VTGVVLPHDWLTHRLRTTGEVTTDRGDASGTGYWSPFVEGYRADLVALAFGRQLTLPRVAGPAEPVGETATGSLLAAGTGDNMAAALGLGLGPGDAVVSIGTSGTVFAVSTRPTADGSGTVAGFADATGRYLPLVCTLNAARVLTAVGGLLGVPLSTVDDLALSARPGAGGLTLLPYLDGERTPNLPEARGVLAGLTRANAAPANLARAAVEGLLCGLADGVDALRAQGVPVDRILLIGGGAASVAVRALAPALLGAPVAVPEPAEYVALGAARQAAWALSGNPDPPQWTVPVRPVHAEPDDAIRQTYAEVRARAAGLLRGPVK
jgi:xylulokinase